MQKNEPTAHVNICRTTNQNNSAIGMHIRGNFQSVNSIKNELNKFFRI